MMLELRNALSRLYRLVAASSRGVVPSINQEFEMKDPSIVAFLGQNAQYYLLNIETASATDANARDLVTNAS